MATLSKANARTEKELHGIIQKELDALEEGLELIKYEFGTGQGIPDFLCADSGGRLTIIEVKLGEDEDVLFQAMRYYSPIDRDRYAIAKAFPESKIDPSSHPRIVLIAERFSDDLRRLCTLVHPDVELFEYSLLSTPDHKTGIYFHPVSLPRAEEEPSGQVGLEDLAEYITSKKMRELFETKVGQLSSLRLDIERYYTQSYVGFKFKGRKIGYVWVMRKSFEMGASRVGENGRTLGDDVFITFKDGAEDDSKIIEQMQTSYVNLGGGQEQ
jgi:hypothetical protein